MAWVIVVLKLAHDSDIAQIIISDSSESECKQLSAFLRKSRMLLVGLWFHRKCTSLCTAKTCLDLATHRDTEKRGKSLKFLPLLILFIFPRASGYASMSVLVLKVILRVSGRVFKLSCSRIFFRLHILVIPLSNLVANEDYTFVGNRGGLFIRVVIRVVLSYIWISLLGKTHTEGGVFFFS